MSRMGKLNPDLMVTAGNQPDPKFSRSDFLIMKFGIFSLIIIPVSRTDHAAYIRPLILIKPVF